MKQFLCFLKEKIDAFVSAVYENYRHFVQINLDESSDRFMKDLDVLVDTEGET